MYHLLNSFLSVIYFVIFKIKVKDDNKTIDVFNPKDLKNPKTFLFSRIYQGQTIYNSLTLIYPDWQRLTTYWPYVTKQWLACLNLVIKYTVYDIFNDEIKRVLENRLRKRLFVARPLLDFFRCSSRQFVKTV